jgi:hypothetical protein
MANDEIEFNNPTSDDDNAQELSVEDFNKNNFLRSPGMNETLSFEIDRVIKNPVTIGKNSKSGANFNIGLTNKNKETTRYDVITKEGVVYTINTWEIYFKFFGKEGILMKYAKEHNGTFRGAQISIQRLVDGSHASTKIIDLAKIIGKTEAEAVEYQNKVKAAIKEQRLFDVKLLN